MSKVWALSSLEPSEKLVLLAIADFSDDQGQAWPSNKSGRDTSHNTAEISAIRFQMFPFFQQFGFQLFPGTSAKVLIFPDISGFFQRISNKDVFC